MGIAGSRSRHRVGRIIGRGLNGCDGEPGEGREAEEANVSEDAKLLRGRVRIPHPAEDDKMVIPYMLVVSGAERVAGEASRGSG